MSLSLSRMSKSARKMSESEVEGQHKALFKFSGGLTLLTLKTDLIDLGLLQKAMFKTGLMIQERFDQLYQQIVGTDTESNSKKKLFFEVVSSEVMLPSQKEYIDALSGTGLTSVISVDEFGKRKFKQDTLQGYGIYRISDDFIEIGSERQFALILVKEYNAKLLSEDGSLYEQNLPNPFPKIDSKDEKYFDGESFKIQGFQMTETTTCSKMADFGFPDWGTSTGSKALFCSRKGEIFVLTTGRAADVVAPYVDPTFAQKISEWVRTKQKNLVQKSALFNNRHKSYDILISLSLMARALRGESFEPLSTCAAHR